MHSILKGGLKDRKESPTAGEVQKFDTLSHETSAEKDSNETKQHVVEGPKSKDLGMMNDLHS